MENGGGAGRLNADFIRLVYLHATKETKNYLDVIDPVDEEVGHEADAAGGRRDRDLLVQRSRFLAALKKIRARWFVCKTVMSVTLLVFFDYVFILKLLKCSHCFHTSALLHVHVSIQAF